KEFEAQIDNNSSTGEIIDYIIRNETVIDKELRQRLSDYTYRPPNISNANLAEYAELMFWKTLYSRFFEDHNPEFLREMSKKHWAVKGVYENRLMKGYKDRGGEE